MRARVSAGGALLAPGGPWLEGMVPAASRSIAGRAGSVQPPFLCPQGTQQVAAVSSVSPATPFQSVPPTVSQTPVIAATPVPTITANVTSAPVPSAAAPPPPATPIIPVVPPTPPVVKVSFPRGRTGCRQVWGGQEGAPPLSPGTDRLSGVGPYVTLDGSPPPPRP